MQHARRHGGVGQLVDQDKAAQVAIGFIGLKGDVAVGRQIGHADSVQFQHLGRHMLQAVDVDLVLGRLDIGRDGLGAQLQPVGAARQHGLVGHPHDGRLELIGRLGGGVGLGQHVAARAVDFVGQAQGDGLAGEGLVQVAIQGDDARDLGGLARGHDTHRVAHAHGAGRDQA